jgi:hypothetical protein
VAVASVAVRPKAVDLALPQWSDAPSPVMPMPGLPMQIGAPRALSSLQSAGDMARTLRWSGTPEGGQVAAISITSAGAHGLRLGLVVDAMPDAAELRLYRKDRSKTGFETTGKAINEAIARNRRADGDTRAAGIWWTPDLGADEVTLEIALPAGLSTSQLRIAIPTLTHAYVNLALPVELELRDSLVPRNVGDAAGCELDASCADQYATERNAVARMTYVGPDNRYYYCTGSLLNNTGGTNAVFPVGQSLHLDPGIGHLAAHGLVLPLGQLQQLRAQCRPRRCSAVPPAVCDGGARCHADAAQ